MAFSLRPDRIFPDYTHVTPKLLKSRGIKLLLSDMDYTLAPKSQKKADAGVIAWLQEMADAGITVVILSNNRSPKRVNDFCGDLGIGFVGHAGKPSTRGFREAMDKYGVTAGETAMLGDKLLTDMLGAHRSGIWALMVEPKGGPVGAWNYVLHALQKPFKAFPREK